MVAFLEFRDVSNLRCY